MTNDEGRFKGFPFSLGHERIKLASEGKSVLAKPEICDWTNEVSH
jgi:hypothetical protein